MLNPPQQPIHHHHQLPSPPTIHSPAPFKLRLRARNNNKDVGDGMGTFTPRKKITKRAAAAPRGANKRRREADDEMDRDTYGGEDNGNDTEEDENTTPMQHERPSTPKRMRFAPEILPMGLERSDFHDLRLQEVLSLHPSTTTNTNTNPNNAELVPPIPSIEPEHNTRTSSEWTNEDDRLLVELVLEKLKLSKSEWQDCARSLGKDRGSVGRRWKSLMGAGEVGLKSRPRRKGIHGTWR